MLVLSGAQDIICVFDFLLHLLMDCDIIQVPRFSPLESTFGRFYLVLCFFGESVMNVWFLWNYLSGRLNLLPWLKPI